MIERRQTLFRSETMFETGDNPILVTCTDFSDWVCKHGRLQSRPLFHELMGSRFAQLWNLRTPPISLIEVSPDHLSQDYLNIVQPAFFRKPCFGSSYIVDGNILNDTWLPSFRKASFRKKLKNKNDLLKIGLFDLWLGNDDRHQGNMNLLLDQVRPKELYFTVFDHGAIFNTGTLSRGLVLLSEDETIISSQFSRLLFGRLNNLSQIVDNIVEDFYLCVDRCEDNLGDILNDIPDEWGLDIADLEALMREHLFNDEWFGSCETHFRTLIQTYLLPKT